MKEEGGPGVRSENRQALGIGDSVWLEDRGCLQRAGGHLHGQGGCSQTANQICRLQMPRKEPPSLQHQSLSAPWPAGQGLRFNQHLFYLIRVIIHLKLFIILLHLLIYYLYIFS